ncbi:MAG TPA: sigma-54 dependent transcriptional regulator [Xanthomonadaceae bacterium]|jgi:DNA-binding NtrC family response regulator|nr:sigma-54 dependent transcriptional regulator [Xanthomonadaceae bacterium]
MHEPVLVIVGNDRTFAAQAADLARNHGFATHVAHSVAEAERYAGMPRDLSLLDMSLPDGSGYDVLEKCALDDYGKVVFLTGEHGAAEDARGAALPASDYLSKPLDPGKLDQLLREVSVRVSRRDAGLPAAEHGLIGESRPMQRLRREIARIAPSNVAVLLTGETGTGKEVVARAIHRASGRRGPLVAVNCGAIAPDLLASQLFGHERGSFTGANTRHIGVFEQAQHGTLFLDEIAEMPPQMQVYLLRVLESGSVTRVGGNSEISVAARVVAATNRNPAAAIADGQLREDLYYRLAGYEIGLPPLRDRGDDILQLARAFLDQLNSEHGTRRRLDPGCEQALLRHPWPGNVRELRSAIARAYLGSEGETVSLHPQANVEAPAAGGEIVFRVGMSYAEVETAMLLKTLEHFDGDKRAAAAALGVSTRTIHNQLARLRMRGNR